MRIMTYFDAGLVPQRMLLVFCAPSISTHRNMIPLTPSDDDYLDAPNALTKIPCDEQ
jgi:hypothetical protein